MPTIVISNSDAHQERIVMSDFTAPTGEIGDVLVANPGDDSTGSCFGSDRYFCVGRLSLRVSCSARENDCKRSVSGEMPAKNLRSEW
jgi:hypothetical protein